MSNKGFLIVVAIIVVGAAGFIIISSKNTPKRLQIDGVSHHSQGEKHIQEGATHPAYNSDPPSSGWHYSDASAPTSWGVYTQELPPEIYLHNEEHGGVIVTYNPTLLPAAQLKKLQALFALPYSDKSFTPAKAIVMPRAADKHMIELASWTVTYNMDSYDQTKLEDFYYEHIGHSPEPTAGPFSAPINQAASQ